MVAIEDCAISKLISNNYYGKIIENIFTVTTYTIKAGGTVVKDGEIIATPMGTTICTEGKVKISAHKAMLEDVKTHWRDHYSINFNNYPVQDAYVPQVKIVNGA